MLCIDRRETEKKIVEIYVEGSLEAMRVIRTFATTYNGKPAIVVEVMHKGERFELYAKLSG